MSKSELGRKRRMDRQVLIQRNRLLARRQQNDYDGITEPGNEIKQDGNDDTKTRRINSSKQRGLILKVESTGDYEESTGDNIRENINAPDKSSSLPTVVKNLPAINLVVDLKDNMIYTYSSQEMVGNTVDENVEVNNEEIWEENETVGMQHSEGDAQHHLNDVLD